jgi:predicted RNase H-like nuclease (RuvC/YqgF family)
MAIVNGKMTVTDSAELTLRERQELDTAQAQIALLTGHYQDMQKTVAALASRQSTLLESCNNSDRIKPILDVAKEQITILERRYQDIQKSVATLTTKQSSLFKPGNSLDLLKAENIALKKQYSQLTLKIARQQKNQYNLMLGAAIALIVAITWMEVRLTITINNHSRTFHSSINHHISQKSISS